MARAGDAGGVPPPRPREEGRERARHPRADGPGRRLPHRDRDDGGAAVDDGDGGQPFAARGAPRQGGEARDAVGAVAPPLRAAVRLRRRHALREPGRPGRVHHDVAGGARVDARALPAVLLPGAVRPRARVHPAAGRHHQALRARRGRHLRPRGAGAPHLVRHAPPSRPPPAHLPPLLPPPRPAAPKGPPPAPRPPPTAHRHPSPRRRYHNGHNWRHRFKLVVGVVHTNYLFYAETWASGGKMLAKTLEKVNQGVCAAYCDKARADPRARPPRDHPPPPSRSRPSRDRRKATAPHATASRVATPPPPPPPPIR